MLRDEFNRWEELLNSLSEEQIISPHLPSGWCIRDVIAHLMAWQQISIARLRAARYNREPAYPDWLGGLDPESEKDREQFNDRIFKAHHRRPWAHVHQDWRDGFLSFLRLGEDISEDNLLDTEKYPWLKGYSLLAVLEGSYVHHHEHFESLLNWLLEQGT